MCKCEKEPSTKNAVQQLIQNLIYGAGCLLMGVILVSCSSGAMPEARANSIPTTSESIQNPQHTLDTWTLVIVVESGTQGIAITHLDGFGTAQACLNSVQFAMARNDTSDAYCLSHAP